MDPRALIGRAQFWGIAVAAAGLFTALFAIQSVHAVEGLGFARALARQAPPWVGWCVVLPVLTFVVSRAHRQSSIGRLLAVHGAAVLPVVLLQMTVSIPLSILLGIGEEMGSGLELVTWFFVTVLPSELVRYVMFAAALHACFNFQEAVVRRELEAALAYSRLQVVRQQLNPHFLFNSLHAIGDLVRNGDRGDAVETIWHLSELLRRALRDSDIELVSLEEELDSLEHYLEIQRRRFGARLQVVIDIEPGTGRLAVPPMILQPLVENAIIHGLDVSSRGPARLGIAAFRRNGDLILEVRDNGTGLPNGKPTEGLGTANTRYRLQHLYGDRQEFRIEPAPTSGTCARISIPAAEPFPEVPPGFAGR